jgi:hypothetical protein
MEQRALPVMARCNGFFFRWSGVGADFVGYLIRGDIKRESTLSS